jgi:hypothetical protein
MARYPGRRYTHQYGNLVVTVESKEGYYEASVTRPSDGFEVVIGTPERTPIDAARYALQVLTNPDYPGLERASEELGQDAAAALAEVAELSGARMGAKGDLSVGYIMGQMTTGPMTEHLRDWIISTFDTRARWHDGRKVFSFTDIWNKMVFEKPEFREELEAIQTSYPDVVDVII